MLFNLKKQMEDQQAEMIRLREMVVLKKMQQLVSRLDYSKKSIHYGSRSLPVPPKEELELPVTTA